MLCVCELVDADELARLTLGVVEYSTSVQEDSLSEGESLTCASSGVGARSLWTIFALGWAIRRAVMFLIHFRT